MKYQGAGRLRISGAALLAVLAICGIGGACAGKAQPSHRHAQQAQQLDGATGTSGSLPPPGQPAPMRYYGGPKSPMWRG